MEKEYKWLEWAKELQAIAQDGLTYTRNKFEIERFTRIREISAEIMAEHSNADFAKVLDLFKAQAGYATPKVDVRGVIFKENKVLLVKEKSDGGWTLPGGWADPNESPKESVEREVFEESGFITEAVRVLAVYDRDKQGHTPPFPFHIYKIFFLCELKGGEKKLSIETDGVDFFAEDNIPNLSDARTKESQLKLFFKMNRDGEQKADFD